jgi:hypothetical protein
MASHALLRMQDVDFWLEASVSDFKLIFVYLC